MKRKGFTLVELAIVLVIIGLLIGGILAAQSMIETTKIQAQIRQFQQFDVMATNFKTKFGELPGDCDNCGHNQQLCNDGCNCTENRNGNNDGKVGGGIYDQVNGWGPTPYTVPPVATSDESQFFFPDLYNMGLITQRYTYCSNGAIGSNNSAFPAASIGRGGGVVVVGNNLGDNFYTIMTNCFGGSCNFYAGYLFEVLSKRILTPAEALALDTKLDDGMPTSGNVAAVKGNQSTNTDFYPLQSDDASNGCITNTTPATYNTSNSNQVCLPVIKANFQ